MSIKAASKSHIYLSVAVSIIAAVLVLLYFFEFRQVCHRDTTLFTFTIPGEGIFFYKERFWGNFRKTRWFYEYSLKWKPLSTPMREYYIWSGDHNYNENIEVRASGDHKRVWFVYGGEVFASLDFKTGEFIGVNGVILDPRVPLDDQESAGAKRYGQPGQPDWARPDEGIVLLEYKTHPGP